MRRLIFVVIYFVFSFYQPTISLKPELHATLSNSEMRTYLQADSHEEVPEYDVIKISRQRNKRSDRPSQKRFSLSAFGKDIELLVEPNNDVVDTDQGLSVERRTVGGTLEKEIHFPKGRFYVGHIASDPNAHVAVREIDEEKGHLSGAFMSDRRFYQIEPLPDHLHQRTALQETGHHVITRRSVNSFMKERIKSVPVKVPGFEHRYKRSVDKIKLDDDYSQDSVYNGTVYIEAMLTADITTCHYYGNGTLDYLLNTANLVSRLYKDKSLGMNVSWVLVKVFLLEGFDPDMDLTANQVTSAGRYIGKFGRWSQKKNTPDGTEGHFDQAALLTRRICGLSNCYMDGLAYFDTPCSSKYGVSVNEARGLTAAFTVAHEMGHNIGLPHDKGECAKGDIMNSVQASGPNAFHWSRCSRAKLQKIFTSLACFQNKPPRSLPSPSLPPGYVNNIDKQCQLAYGEEYKACPSLRESCGALYCSTGGSCYSRGAPVAEGTACGYRKWCMAGTCTQVGTSLPPPVDGNWGPWGSYGACTRTCGGGVKYRSRHCDNPRPHYFGKDCIGSSKGHFEICKTEECAVDRFRQEQCEHHNSDTKKYHAYYPSGARKCSLACASGNKWSFFGNVKDGTRCTQDPHDYDVCIDGKCQMVGCDKKLLSGKLLDRCLICGGDGSSCVLIKGLYNKNYRVYGRYKGDTMFVIPKGATRIFIKEISKSFNFLSLVSNSTGKYYVPVPSWTKTFNAAGTSIYHFMKTYNDAEIISARGPTNEALQAKFVYSGHHRNPGIEYSYYIPGNGPRTTFVWKQRNEGSCSATCAGGNQLIKVTCHRQDDDTQVTPIYCDKSAKPKESLPCNMAPCPKEFQLGVWSPCSKQCGGGQKHRNLTCAQVVSKDVTRVLPESECANLPRPAGTQGCGNKDCLPEWTVGEWTQCSVPCGGGNKNRQVECRQTFANGTWSNLPDDQCNVRTSKKPPTSMTCNSIPCFKWRVEYPCLSCGGTNFSYAPIGCFKDKHNGIRPLPEMIGNHRNNINWYHMTETVMKCAKDAWAKNYTVFGVQFYGECWSGASSYKTYDKDGLNKIGCWEGVGMERNNYVYAFTNLASMPLVHCISTASNQPVQEDKCPVPKPDPKMKLCTDVCKS